MKSHLRKTYKNEMGLDIAISTFDSTFKEILPYESNLSSSEYELISNRVSLNDWCLVKIFLNNNVLEFVFFLFVLLLLIFGILKEGQKKEQIQIAETLYKCIVLYIRENGNVSQIFWLID